MLLKIDRLNLGIEGKLNNAISPKTVTACLQKHLVDGVVLKRDGFLMFKWDLDVGFEKPKNKFSAGELAYNPPNQWFILFSEETDTLQPSNSVGFFYDIDFIKRINNRDVISISFS